MLRTMEGVMGASEIALSSVAKVHFADLDFLSTSLAHCSRSFLEHTSASASVLDIENCGFSALFDQPKV